MNDPNATSHLDDERLSALVDGEATPEDEEHVHLCPHCAATLTTWQQALNELTAPVGLVDTARRDAAIDAALTASSAADATTSAVAPGSADGRAPVDDAADAAGAAVRPVSLEDHRRRRAGLVGPRVAAAVAAVIVIAGAAVGVWQAGGSSHPTASSSAVTHVSAASGAGPSAAVTPRPEPVSGITTPAAGAPAAGTAAGGLSLGSYRDTGGLVATLRDQMNAASSAVRSAPSAPTKAPAGAAATAQSPCLSQAATAARVPARTSPVLAATLTYRDSPAEVYVFPVGRDHTAAVVGVPDCRLLALAAF